MAPSQKRAAWRGGQVLAFPRSSLPLSLMPLLPTLGGTSVYVSAPAGKPENPQSPRPLRVCTHPGASSAIPYLGGENSTGGNPRASDRHRVPQEQRPPRRSRPRQESAGVTPAAQRAHARRLLQSPPRPGAALQRPSSTATERRAGGAWRLLGLLFGGDQILTRFLPGMSLNGRHCGQAALRC